MKKDSPEERDRKRRNLMAAYEDVPELRGLGYQIHEFKPWHWRITRLPDWKTLEVDVWPTTKKMQDRTTWQTSVYTNLLESIEKLFTSDRYMP